MRAVVARRACGGQAAKRARFHLSCRLFGIAGIRHSASRFGDLPKAGPDVLDLPSEIGEHDTRSEAATGGTHMTIMMPASDQAVLDRRDAIVAALRAIVPGEGVIDSAAEMVPLRVRRPDGLSSAADGGGAAGHHRTGLAGSEILLRAGHQGGAARLRHLAVRRRAAAGRRRAARPRQIQAHPRDRFRQPRGGDRARRHQSRHQPGGGPCRILLCARSVVADRLLDRRQCRGKFRRRALPEIRHDHQQRARLRDRADIGRNHPDRRQVRRELRATT